MKQSKYNLRASNGSQVLVFNARTGNYVVLPRRVYQDFMEQNLSAETNETFARLGFYVEDCIDEFEEIQRECSRRLNEHKIKKLRVLTTTGCNAKCPYCYEHGVVHKMMTIETAGYTADFLLSELKVGDTLRIEWFGGEPLLNIPVIDYISNTITKRKGAAVDFASNVVTNGYLINENVVEKMKSEWNVRQVQITLDGIGEDYERVKGFKRGGFEHVIDNIKLLCDNNIKVDIRINFDSRNLQQVEDILRFLSQQDFKDGINVYPAKIFSDETKKGYFDLEEESIQVARLFRKYRFRYGEELIPRTFTTSCMASYPHFYTVSPNGKVFKCDRQFLDKDAIADVKDKPLSSRLQPYVKSNLNVGEKCRKCRLYPLCWGGCFYDRENGLYPCYLTERLVHSSLSLALEDLEG